MKKICLLFALFTMLTALEPLSNAGQKNCMLPIPYIYSNVSPSVVLVTSIATNAYAANDKSIPPYTSYGTGFIFREDGMILTSAHLVADKITITVKLSKGGSYAADLIAADYILDIAILNIHIPAEKLPAVTFIDSNSQINVGEEVIVIGCPGGMENTVSRGIVSGLNRILPTSPMSMMMPMIQTDASIGSGSSGSPMINRCGEVIGMVAGFLNDEENIGFALPIHSIKNVLNQLLQTGKIRRPWFGVRGKLISKAEWESIFKINFEDGFLVESVDPGSPAKKMGLQGGQLPVTLGGEDFLLGGDIIVSANGLTFDKRENFENFARSMKIGDIVQLAIFRKGKIVNAEFVVPERPLLPRDIFPDPFSR